MIRYFIIAIFILIGTLEIIKMKIDLKKFNKSVEERKINEYSGSKSSSR